jgi:hypothetical protein
MLAKGGLTKHRPISSVHLRLLVLIVAGWINRGQQDKIEYLQAENRVLREQLGSGRLRLTDAQRCRLAASAKRIGLLYIQRLQR